MHLGPSCRVVIAMDLDDVPGPDIAAALCITPQQVRDLRAKAYRQLKKHLAVLSRRWEDEGA